MVFADLSLPQSLCPMLVIDCSSDWCTLGLLDVGGVQTFNERLRREHSARLLLEVEKLQQASRNEDTAVGSVGVVAGPGSFTGVRIAVATAQAFAYANDCPVVRLDALELLARSWQLEDQRKHAKVVCARRSRAELFYCGAYALEDDGSRRLGELTLLGDLASCERWLRAQRLDAPVWLGDTPSWLGQRSVIPVDPSPTALLRLAARQFAAGLAVSAADALPLYLSADSPWHPIS